MHKVAEEGIAAHWDYKENNGKGPKDTEKFTWLRRLIEWQQDLKDPQEFLSTVKEDLFSEEVYVFTPKGDVLEFPPGATVIDFAFRIHSQVGSHLTGARVNGRMVPLRFKLRSGDTVEVITADKQNPGKDWLNYAVTARAKSRIRQWLRAQQATRSIQLGVALLDHELEPLGLSVAQLKRENRFEGALKELSQKDADGILAAVGYGIVTVNQALGKLLSADELKAYRGEKTPAAGVPPSKDRIKEARRAASGGVVVSGIGDVMVRFAKCCSPLPGETIIGFITRGRGVTVHLFSCPRALESDPQRQVPVVWREGEDSPRPIRIEVVCVDQPGLLAAMSKAIAAVGVNISTAEVRNSATDGRAVSNFEVHVSNAHQLDTLMRSLAAIDGVTRVSRLGQKAPSPPRGANRTAPGAGFSSR
jgi:GTP pyrophosphokinase